MQGLAPAWHEALNAGKETVALDLKADPERGHALCAAADVVSRASGRASPIASASARGRARNGRLLLVHGLRRHGRHALAPATT